MGDEKSYPNPSDIPPGEASINDVRRWREKFARFEADAASINKVRADAEKPEKERERLAALSAQIEGEMAAMRRHFEAEQKMREQVREQVREMFERMRDCFAPAMEGLQRSLEAYCNKHDEQVTLISVLGNDPMGLSPEHELDSIVLAIAEYLEMSIEEAHKFVHEESSAAALADALDQVIEAMQKRLLG